MPHFNADVARRSLATRDFTPITFTLCGERFTARREPSFGDVLELADAPEPTPENAEQAAFSLSHFIERMLPDEDRVRWRSVLRDVPASQTTIIIELGVWLSEQITGNPSKPPANSARGRRSSGGTSRKPSAGQRRSN